jgi:2-methylcitrate dehydratase PrpD
MGISLELGKFVSGTRFDNIPSDVIVTEKMSVLDNIGNIFGASGLDDNCRGAISVATEMSGVNPAQEATVIGFNRKLPAAWAAFANAAMVHSLDYGDTYLGKGSSAHPNSSTFAAALAVAEKIGNIDGRMFLTAMIVGSEIACRIAGANQHKFELDGFYPPSILTSFGATAAVCKLLGLTTEQIVDSFSFNLNQTTCSAELVNNANTSIRSIRECFAAKSAVLSGYLAREGLKGFEEPIDGKFGFIFAYTKGQFDHGQLLKNLGTEFESGKLMFKSYPSCMGTHPAIVASLKLVEENNIKPEEIEHVHIKVSSGNFILVEPLDVKRTPKSSIIAKFSSPYTSAVAILNGSVKLTDFSDAMLNNPKLIELTSKYTCEVNKDWGKDKNEYSEVTIDTKRGSFSKLVTSPPGGPDSPLSYEALCAKMRDCASFAYLKRSDSELNEIQYTIEHLDELGNIKELTKLL